MTALDISGKNDGRVFAEDFPVVYMTERPVIISLCGQLGG
jgi:hypothetical protein